MSKRSYEIRRLISVLALALIVVFSVYLILWPISHAIRVMQYTAEAERVTELLKPIHEQLTYRMPGGRVATKDEPGQTYAEFREKYRQSQYKTIYIQPIGLFDANAKALVDETAEFISIYFSSPCELLPPIGEDAIPITKRRKHLGQTQFNASFILNKVLKPLRPEDAIAVLALTSTDLFPSEEYNYVFGLASLSERVGVWSMQRYGEPGTEIFRKRLFKVAAHETGHMFGIPHCIAYDCLMNASNNRNEVDRCPLWMCPECVQKISFARNKVLPDYFSELQNFAQVNGFISEKSYWKQCRDATASLQQSKLKQ